MPTAHRPLPRNTAQGVGSVRQEQALDGAHSVKQPDPLGGGRQTAEEAGGAEGCDTIAEGIQLEIET